MENKPLLIVMTPVKNEAWVLHAFLKATSTWADYIIVADQMSTDGSRDIYPLYPKVIMIDNNNSNFNEPERQAMLISKAREIADGRDTILFALDADEIMEAGFQEKDDWQKIINSKPRDVFWFRWGEMTPEMDYYYEDTLFQPWVFHDDGIEKHGNYVRSMHSMRIPYPIEEKQMYYVNEFRVLHLNYLNSYRVKAKNRFYQVIEKELNNANSITISRTYAVIKRISNRKVDNNVFLYDSFDLIDFVDKESRTSWYYDYILSRYIDDLDKLAILNIWDNDWLTVYNIKDPRKWYHKMLHWYLNRTMKYKNLILIRGIDKILKYLT